MRNLVGINKHNNVHIAYTCNMRNDTGCTGHQTRLEEEWMSQSFVLKLITISKKMTLVKCTCEGVVVILCLLNRLQPESFLKLVPLI